MWKIILGVIGLIIGLPAGGVVGSGVFFVLADRQRINWFHGDDRLSWVIPLSLVLGPMLGGAAGLLVGAMLDRGRARRRHDPSRVEMERGHG